MNDRVSICGGNKDGKANGRCIVCADVSGGARQWVGGGDADHSWLQQCCIFCFVLFLTIQKMESAIL